LALGGVIRYQLSVRLPCGYRLSVLGYQASRIEGFRVQQLLCSSLLASVIGEIGG
jgi:hypothetical protein